MGKGGGITGYMYFLAVQAGLCRGPIDEIIEIRADGQIAWQGSVTDSTTIRINAAYLFGGPQKEGGLNGTLDVYMGGPTQTYSDYWKNMMGAVIPDFRGVATTVFNGEISANNPYPKPWRYRVRRVLQGWDGGTPWYPERALIPISGLLVEFTKKPEVGDTMNFNGHVAEFINGASDPNHISLGESLVETAEGFQNYINANSGLLGLTCVGTDTRLAISRTIPWSNGQSPYTISRSGLQPLFNNQSTVKQNSVTINPGAIHAMNGAHIIYECCTNRVWGRGLSASQLDLRSFTLAADTMFGEGLGLCMQWSRQTSLSDFVQSVLDHIAGALYTNRENGLITLKLLRQDYEPSVVPLFDSDSGLLDIQDDETGAAPNAVSEVIVNYQEPITNTARQTRAQNIGIFQSTLNPTSITTDYKGAASWALANRLAYRDLKTYGLGLKRLTVVLDRRGWAVQPASVIRIRDTARGITNLILRVLTVDAGNILEGKVTLKCQQDVYGMPADTFGSEQTGTWVPPNNTPEPATTRAVYEATYRDVIYYLTTANQAAMTPDTGGISTLAVRPAGLVSAVYLIDSSANGAPEVLSNAVGWCPGGVLAAACGALDNTATIDLTTASDLDLSPATPFAAWIGGEWCRVDSFDLDTGIMTLGRGCLDTVPEAHAAGDVVLFADYFAGSDGVVYAVTENVAVQLLSQTSSGLLDPSLAPTDNVIIQARHNLPYPPALVKVDGIVYAEISTLTPGDHVITWVGRNRLTQQDALVDFTEAEVAPEDGTTYNIRVYKAGSLVRTTTGITGDSWTYTSAMQTADGNPPRVVMELESERDGVTSFTFYEFTVPLDSGSADSGFGYNFGASWGH